MSGIVSYGTYIPFNRLQRSVIAEVLGTRGGKGEKAVASYDEDTATMAVEASRACLAGRDTTGISSLFFATTDPPYQEKLNAATVHAALDLPRTVRALDLGCSVRAGIGALIAARDAAAAGGTALAAMSDIRIGAPEGAVELSGGDAAAAFLLGTQDVIAEVVATYSETLEYLSTWRLPGERYARAWEERFSLTQAYVPLLGNAAKGLLAKAGIGPDQLAAVVLDAPNPRAIAAVAKGAGLEPQQIVDGRAESVGHAGAAQAGVMLASALDKASPGDYIAVLSVSDGVDAVLLRATDAIAGYEPARSVDSLVASGRDDLSYAAYLKWRGILETEPPRRPDPERPAAPPSFRSERWKFAFVGCQCEACGTYHLPPHIVCVKCGERGRMKDVPFADRQAVVRTFTLDRLAFTPQPPMVVAVIDFEGGGRVQSEYTDCDPAKVSIGDSVEMTFRRLFTAAGVHNYFWKARPER